MRDRGTILGVVVDELKSSVTDAVAAGATSLPLGLLVDFDPSGGSAVLGNDPAVDPVVSYIGVDYDTYTLQLESPLAAAVDADTPVKNLNARGEVEREKRVLVDRGEDDDADPVEASVDTRLDGHFPEGDDLAGMWVEIESDGDAWAVVSTPFDAPPLDATHLYIPRGRATRSNSYVINTGTTTYATLATFDASWSTPEWSLVGGHLTYTGPPCVVVATASCVWSANSSSFRRISILPSNDTSSDIVAQVDPDTADPTRQTVTGIFDLESGESLRIGFRQQTGGDLTLTAIELRAVVVGYQ